MKNKFLLPVILLIFALQCSLLYKDKSFAQQKNFGIENLDLPPVTSQTLNNGVRVFFINDELPRLTIALSAGFGKLYETSSNAGISGMLAKTISLAGSKKYPAAVLHNTIEKIGGKFAVESSFEETVIIIEVLDRYSDLAFDILKDLVLNPNLDPKIIESARSLMLEEVRRRSDSPESLAFEKAREIIFAGAGYGAYVTEKSIKSISRDDLVNIFNNYFTADNIIAGISSSLQKEKIKKHIQVFDDLKGSTKKGSNDYSINLNFIKDSIEEKSKNIYLLPKNIPQATMVAGTIAPSIKYPSFFPLTLMNDILGGSDFNSRLMQEIREKRGLAYSVQSVIRFRKKTGVFLAFAQTNTESADISLSLLLENIDLMSKSIVTDQELKLAFDSMKNSYIFEFDSPVSILKKYSFVAYNGLPDTFFVDYLNQMGNVTREEIKKSTALLLSNGLIKVVVGKKELEAKLGKFGKVVIINEF